ncbi:uncharacterized protein CIMG_13274 [Coccidioides immitis RS]|uniref:Uncharacterized protein n=1 Tax=Coccidioides immitis (strain RS) TaxID=246410 RepID=A0A0D8JV88_COCIM|nr:uncharacterized protein CIMG_13274 [Coccidioides immitis RS]KJF60846.1 hypothetical protein CIMG_13274 [Coccidioides immitis RS]
MAPGSVISAARLSAGMQDEEEEVGGEGEGEEPGVLRREAAGEEKDWDVVPEGNLSHGVAEKLLLRRAGCGKKQLVPKARERWDKQQQEEEEEKEKKKILSAAHTKQTKRLGLEKKPTKPPALKKAPEQTTPRQGGFGAGVDGWECTDGTTMVKPLHPLTKRVLYAGPTHTCTPSSQSLDSSSLRQ